MKEDRSISKSVSSISRIFQFSQVIESRSNEREEENTRERNRDMKSER